MKIYSGIYFGNVVFICNVIGIRNIDINNINPDNNFDEDDLDTIILVRLLAQRIEFEKRKALKKETNEEMMLVAWHPNRWWNFCIPEDETKEIEPIFLE